ncbi:MAG: DUF3299 domain-containing protein [Thalassolituus sp.]|uniref:DUF3299 domain-containing protein n=1 Tax=Thalassolituus sp. TaxID=2030822 RepID=UPI0039821C0E
MAINSTRSLVLIALTPLLFACSDTSEPSTASKSPASESTAPESLTSNTSPTEQALNTEADKSAKAAADDRVYQEIEWEALIPEQDLQALLSPPESLNNIEEGSSADQIGNDLNQQLTKQDNAYQQALNSTRVREEMDGKTIRIAGFVVPLEFDDDQRISEFFLVPYFGACIHVPPPPPNQIIYSKSATKFQLDNLYDPVWVEGTLTTTLTENSVARSAYSLNVDSLKPYYEQEESTQSASTPGFLD